jgi:hypothetical protein
VRVLFLYDAEFCGAQAAELVLHDPLNGLE